MIGVKGHVEIRHTVVAWLEGIGAWEGLLGPLHFL